MEDLFLSQFELQILQNKKQKLESRYKVKLNMPQVKGTDSCGTNEVIFASIVGGKQNINNVKKFLKRKVDSSRGYEQQENDTSVIVLNSDSDSDLEEENVLSEEKVNMPKKKKCKREAPLIDLVSSPVAVEIPHCEVSSTTIDLDESVSIVAVTTSPAEEFIPLISKKTENLNCTLKTTPVDLDDTVLLSSDEEVEIPRTIPRDPKLLRPIVIDGSNVARAHGHPKNTYSCKGIKICVDHFLKRGHTQVTAMVPLFRRHCKYGPIKTVDQEILEELYKTGNLVFTPSRKVEGKTYACYDDRFIVKLAAENGGVILSNDNFHDLLNDSPAFKETIQTRLLMFVFVGDLLMIPEDPMGQRGPTLEEFLSFPPV